MSYITIQDITDNIAQGHDLTQYILETDSEIEDMAERLGVRTPADIETDPLHFKIKRYAISYLLTRLCQDKIGTNNIDVPELEKYVIKYNLYTRELDKLRSLLSYEMFVGTINEIRDRSINSGTIYHG